MTLTYAAVRDSAAAILRRKLPALANRIYIDRQWPTGPDLPPCIIVSSGPAQWESSNARAGHPEFTVTGSIGVSIRAQARSEDQMRAILEPLAEAVLFALCQQPDGLLDLPGMEQVLRINRANAAGNEGDRLEAQISYAIDCVWHAEYPPAAGVPLRRIRLAVDAIDPADPLGPYQGIDPFPAPPAPPRATGPDGRAEAGADIAIPE